MISMAPPNEINFLPTPPHRNHYFSEPRAPGPAPGPRWDEVGKIMISMGWGGGLMISIISDACVCVCVCFDRNV